MTLCALLAGLACTMRGYQRRALAWMASREAGSAQPDQHGSTPRSSSSKSAATSSAIWNGASHPSWQRVTLPSGQPFYHNWMTGMAHSRPSPQNLVSIHLLVLLKAMESMALLLEQKQTLCRKLHRTKTAAKQLFLQVVPARWIKQQQVSTLQVL